MVRKSSGFSGLVEVVRTAQTLLLGKGWMTGGGVHPEIIAGSKREAKSGSIVRVKRFTGVGTISQLAVQLHAAFTKQILLWSATLWLTPPRINRPSVLKHIQASIVTGNSLSKDPSRDSRWTCKKKKGCGLDIH